MVQIAFNAAQYEPSTGAADVLETGVYSVQIVSSEVKQTKAGNGYMLVFGLSCLDQGFTGRKLTVRLNIQNPNAQAVEIAYRELSAISHVVGVLAWQDTQQLHGRPFKVSVEKVARQDDPTKFSNDIKAYMDYAGNPPNGQGGQGASSSPVPAAPPAAPTAPAQQPNFAQAPAPTQPQYGTVTGSAPAPAPAAAPAAAPWQQGAPAQAPAPAPQPPQPSAPAAAPWQQGPAAAPAAPAAPAPAAAPWQQPGAAAPQAGAPVPPWQQG